MVPDVKLLEERKSVLVSKEDGAPVPVQLAIEESRSTPGRIRVAFALDVEDPENGLAGTALLGPPFRIESN